MTTFLNSTTDQRAFKIYQDLIKTPLTAAMMDSLLHEFPENKKASAGELLALRAYAIADAFAVVELKRAEKCGQ